MKPKKLIAYKGSMSAADIASGINAAIANGKRLADDAELLLNAGRFPSAASIAALSIEESGKVSILRQLATAQTQEGISAAWKAYRSHTSKNSQWLLPDLARQGARKLDDLKPLFSPDAEHPFLLDQLKQLGFYTDCLGKKHWSAPIDVIDESLARSLVQTAKLLVGKREVTTEEIELWIEHVGSTEGTDPDNMRRGLINWYAAMQQRKLLPAGRNEMERFINEGV